MLALVFPNQAIPVLPITALQSGGSPLCPTNVTAKLNKWLEDET